MKYCVIKNFKKKMAISMVYAWYGRIEMNNDRRVIKGITINHLSQKFKLLDRGTWMVLYFNTPSRKSLFRLEVSTMHRSTLPCTEI